MIILNRCLPAFGLLLAVSILTCADDSPGVEDADVTSEADALSDADFRDHGEDAIDADAIDLPDSELDAQISDASQFPWSPESNDSTCADGLDNDDNGYTDCSDFGCSRNLAVTVCGADAQYEASPAHCANGLDDDGDGLTDCEDPDCGRNPFHATCERPRVEDQCGTGTDGDGDGATDCEDTDCRLLGEDCDTIGLVRVLFDQTLDETSAGGPNSDWVIDGFGRLPVPSEPTGPNDWQGALSSFGYELWQGGEFLVESLPSWEGRLTFEDDDNPQDLSHYDILVLFEPSRPMTDDEKTAVIQFVFAGGGLLAVANHVGADRDGNGYSAPMVFNDLFDDNPVALDPFGFRFDEIDASTGSALDRVVFSRHPVISGRAGEVERIGFYQGCTAHLTQTNERAYMLILLSEHSAPNTDIVVGAAEAGEGRVVFLTDSAIGGDGTDSHGSRQPDHDSWNSTTQDQRTLFLNAMDWLAGVTD